MKHTSPTPIGISRVPTCAELPEHTDPRAEPTRVPPALAASEIRRNARILLDLPRKDHRLHLILAQLLVILLSLAVPMMLDCLSVVIYALPYFTGVENFAWLVILRGVLWGANLILIVFPLWGGLYRLAVLMVKSVEPLSNTANERFQSVSAWECLYPFASGHAYARTLYVCIRAVLRVILMLLPPAAILWGAAWGLPLLSKICPPVLCSMLWMLAVAAVCLTLLVMALWNARGTGLAYWVFAHPEQSLLDLSEAFKSTPKGAEIPLLMRLSLLGWFILSFLAVLVPLLLHTVPYMLLCEAMYGRSFASVCSLKSQEETDP